VFVALGIQHAIAHAPYFRLWTVRLYSIFFTLSYKRHDFRNKIETKCVFWFSLQRLSETFLILGRTERDMIKKCVFWFSLQRLSETFLILGRTERDMNKKFVFWFSVKRLSETFLILGRTERDVIKKCILIFILFSF